MQRADQRGLVRVEADRLHLDLEILRMQDDFRTRDGEFAQATIAKAAADHDALGLRPGLGLQEAAGDVGELLRELLDRAVHHGASLGVVADQDVVERLLADLVRRHLAERVLARLVQRLAPAVENLAERALRRPVAEETLVVLQFEIEAVDIDRGQPRGAVMGNARRGNDVLSHGRSLPVLARGNNG